MIGPEVSTTSGPRRMNQLALSIPLLLMFAAFVPAKAADIISHSSDTNPTTENFGLWPFNGGITTAPLANDQGVAAFQIANSGRSDEQAVYNQLGGTGPFDPGGSGLTQQQRNLLDTSGFVMSLDTRVVQGPVFDPTGSAKSSVFASLAGLNGSRFDIELGLDANGNTVVVLPDSISFNAGGFFSSTAFGSLVITGDGYHLYQLSWDPTTGTADLFVDHKKVISGYKGSTVSGGATANNYGLAFGATDDGTGNFALVELDSGQLASAPEPGTLAFGVIALGAFAFVKSATCKLRDKAKRNREGHC